jgi:hypothetical protein
MELIMYLTRAPRHENVTAKDITLIEDFFAWRHEVEIGSQYASQTFEKWNGHSENELPGKEIVKFYYPFYTLKERYMEGIGKGQCYGIFEQLARFTNTYELLNWFLVNVMNSKPDRELHEVTKEHFEKLLHDCKAVKNGFVHTGKNWLNVDEYDVNIDLAREFMPMVPEKAYSVDGKVYGTRYTTIIIEVIKEIENILETTDFTKQTVYVNSFVYRG